MRQLLGGMKAPAASKIDRVERLTEWRLGYYISEEYDLWQDRSITRAEYDDGAVVIAGKSVLISGAELRVCYLIPYNFLLCAHDHVAMQGMYDEKFDAILDGILQSTHTIDDLIVLGGDLPRPKRFS